jgi:hypothetical protein
MLALPFWNIMQEGGILRKDADDACTILDIVVMFFGAEIAGTLQLNDLKAGDEGIFKQLTF